MSNLIELDSERDEGILQKLQAYDITKDPELAVEVCEELLDKLPEEEKINDRMAYQLPNLREDER